MSGLKLFASTDHDGHWTSGASIVLAHTEFEARELLTKALEAQGLHEKPFTLKEIDTSRTQAIVLWNGDY